MITLCFLSLTEFLGRVDYLRSEGSRASRAQGSVIRGMLSSCGKDDRERFDVAGRPGSTTVHVRSAVVRFENWLKERRHRDDRYIENIPPKILDEYLAEYFSIVRKVSGEDYSIASFISLRSCMELQLKQKEYPFSITSSFQFLKSQKAFSLRKIAIKKATL